MPKRKRSSCNLVMFTFCYGRVKSYREVHLILDFIKVL